MVGDAVDDAFSTFVVFWRGVAGWEWPSSSKVVQMGHPSLPHSKAAPTSASTAELMTLGMMGKMTWMAPLGLVGWVVG